MNGERERQNKTGLLSKDGTRLVIIPRWKHIDKTLKDWSQIVVCSRDVTRLNIISIEQTGGGNFNSTQIETVSPKAGTTCFLPNTCVVLLLVVVPQNLKTMLLNKIVKGKILLLLCRCSASI